MSDLDGLLNRIDAEFSAADKSLKEFQAREVEAYHGRQERLEKFQRTCEQLKEIWQPRLEALAKKLGEKVNVKPTATPSHREATFRFNSTLADIVLRFSVSTDFEVRNLVLDYDLHILPILMKFDPHSRVEFPLDAVSPAAVASWIDDRLVDFVKTYLAVHQNQFYLKDHMVVDPISSTRFPQFAAAGSVNWEGQKFYFVSGETRAEFMTKHGIKS